MRVILTPLLLVAILGCNRSEPEAPARTPNVEVPPPARSPASEPATAAKPDNAAEVPPAPGDGGRALPSLAPAALDRVDKAMRTPPKMRKALTADTPGLDAMRALSVQWRAPRWAEQTGDLEVVDDDDNRTIWSCEGAACGMGTALDEGTQLHAVRWVGSETAVETLRVHTDAGFADLGPLPARRSRWLVFDPPLPSTKLVFEAAGLSAGDLEVFGSGGVSKPPSTFDPTQAAVVPRDAWAELAQWRLRAEVCLEHGSVCELRGTAALGTPNGRLALIEAIHRTDCETPVGVYLAFDRDTRRIVKLAGATRIPTEVYVHPSGEGFGLVRHDGQIVRIRVEDGTLVEDIITTGPSAEVVPVGRPASALPAPQACPPFPFDGPRPTTEDAQTGARAEASDADNPLRAKLPAAAAKALADDADDGCLAEVTAGDFGRKGGDDFLVRIHECGAEDAYWNVLLVSKSSGRYDALAVPSIGTGGDASFDTHRSGAPVILVEDDCCAHHLVTVAKRRGGGLTTILEAHAVEPDRVEILRDDTGRIRKLRVEKG